MSEKQKLVYRQFALDVECSATDSCECAFCDGCRFLIQTANYLLAIAVENDLRGHYNWLVANMDGLFEAASEKLSEEKYIQ